MLTEIKNKNGLCFPLLISTGFSSPQTCISFRLRCERVPHPPPTHTHTHFGCKHNETVNAQGVEALEGSGDLLATPSDLISQQLLASICE